MRIIASKIPRDGLKLDLQEDLKVEGVDVVAPVRVSLTVRKVGRGVVIEGVLEGKVRLQCGSCLEYFQAPVRSEFTADFRPVPKQEAESEAELLEADLDVSYFSGDEIDLRDVLREQVFLGIPMSPLCREDCKGLCPVCGVNRNRVTCECVPGAVDPRFRALLKLKGEGHGQSNK